MSTKPCGWKCGDSAPGHKHYSVLVRERGKLLGRLTPDGTTTNRKLFALILSRARAEEIAAEINAEPMYPGLTAKVIPF